MAVADCVSFNRQEVYLLIRLALIIITHPTPEWMIKLLIKIMDFEMKKDLEVYLLIL